MIRHLIGAIPGGRITSNIIKWVTGYRVPSLNLPIGAAVQAVSTQTGAVATGTTTIPFDDTIPQNTEGDEYMTLAITPKATTNKLRIDVTAVSYNPVANGQCIVALFQDSVANAIAAVSQLAPNMVATNFSHIMDAGTTSATTFKVRIGYHLAGTTTFNGNSGVRDFGGVMASSIRITEYNA